MFYLLLVVFFSKTLQDFPPMPQAQFPEIDESEYWTSDTPTDSFKLIIMRPPDCLQCDIHAVLVNEVYQQLLGPLIRQILPVFQHSRLDTNISKTLQFEKHQESGFTVLVRGDFGVDFYDYTFLEQEVLIEEQWEAQKERMEKFLRNYGKFSSHQVYSPEDIIQRHSQNNKSDYSIVYVGNNVDNNVEQLRTFFKAVWPEDQLLFMHIQDRSSVVDYFNLDDDSCILILKRSDHEEVQCPKTISENFVVEVIKSFTYSPVLQLWQNRDFGRTKFYTDTTLIVFMEKYDQKNYSVLEKLQEKFQSKLQFGYQVQGLNNYEETLDFAQMNNELELLTYPIVVIVSTRSEKKTYLYEGIYKFDALNIFITNYFRGEIDQYYRSLPIPIENEDQFQEVVGLNFKEQIILSNKSVLLYQYSDRTCDQCKKMEANITASTKQFLSMVKLCAFQSNKNKSPYNHMQGSPRLILYMDQSSFANHTAKQLEGTYLINKLYFVNDNFDEGHITQWLYTKLFKMKMEFKSNDQTSEKVDL